MFVMDTTKKKILEWWVVFCHVSRSANGTVEADALAKQGVDRVVPLVASIL